MNVFGFQNGGFASLGKVEHSSDILLEDNGEYYIDWSMINGNPWANMAGYILKAFRTHATISYHDKVLYTAPEIGTIWETKQHLIRKTLEFIALGKRS